MTLLLAIVLITCACLVCKGASQLNVVYAMLMAAAAGGAGVSALNDAFRGRWDLFLIWSLFGLINTTTVARWLTAHAAKF